MKKMLKHNLKCTSIRMEVIALGLLNFLADGNASAQEVDTIPSYDLDEVVVEASKVIRKADMDVYHPSESAVENSMNGLQLLNNLMIPSLTVDDVMGSIKASGESVQLRINGREASVEQVRNLQPNSIKRVEWIDNPGLRYSGASYVLNFIVTNPTIGGSLMANAVPMLNVLFGNYNVDLKLNNGRSQWSIGAFFKPTVSDKVHRDYFETFTFPDGQKLTRQEIPIGGKIKNTQGSAEISYSYIKPDTTVFYASLSDWSNLDNLSRFNGLLKLSDESQDLNLLNETADKGHTPSLSLYLEQHFSRQQTLAIDFSASLFSGYTSTYYLETYPETEEYLTDIHTYIKDLNQVYGIEADYIKNWEKSRFTGGVSYSANRNRSTYRTLDNAVFHQNQDKLYFFGEYFQRMGKFTVTAGLGVQYNTFVFKETEQGNSSWNLRPQATITYSLNPKHQFRLNFTSWQTTPSLSESNITPQQTDGFQWNVGNPNLKTYNNYRLNFRYAFNFWRVAGNFNVSASTSPNAIAPYLYWEDGYLITSYENSKGKQSLSFSLAPQIELIPKWLTVAGDVSYLAERTSGEGYKLYNHNWSGSVNAILNHWNFSLILGYSKARRSLWGEKLSWGEDFSELVLMYKWKDWQFGAVYFMPFSAYDQGSKMLSKWNTNEFHLRLDFHMIGLVVNYNIHWGKQKRQVDKLIDADAEVDKSAVKSR